MVDESNVEESNIEESNVEGSSVESIDDITAVSYTHLTLPTNREV